MPDNIFDNEISVPNGYTVLFGTVYIKDELMKDLTAKYMEKLTELLEKSSAPKVCFIKKISDNPSIVPLPGAISYQII